MPTQLTTTAYDADNGVLTGRPVSYQSSNPSVATVTSGGLVTLVAPGTATITVTVEGETDTVEITVDASPTTPAELFAAYNALGVGTLGATMRGIYPKSTANVTANGGSFTGFYCSRVDDAIAPSNGYHLRPSAETPAGIECLADGTLIGIAEIPGASGYAVGSTEAITSATPPLANSDGLIDYRSDASAGVTFGLMGKLKIDTNPVVVGTAASTGYMRWQTATMISGLNRAALERSGFKDAFYFTTGSTRQVAQFWGAESAEALYTAFVQYQLGRDVVLPEGPSETFDAHTTGRRIRFNVPGSQTPDVNTGIDLIFCCSGRSNAAQNRLLNNYCLTKYGSAWTGTDALGVIDGDSFIAPVDHLGIADAINAIGTPIFIVNWATSGHDAQQQFTHKNILRDLDFSSRPDGKVVYYGSEYYNGGTLTQNYYWIDAVKALSAKVRTAMHTQLHVGGGLGGASGAAWLTDLRAHAVQDGHASVLIDHRASLSWDDYHFDSPADTPRVYILWDLSKHPSSSFSSPVGPGQDYWKAFHQAGFLVPLGIDDSTRTMYVTCSVLEVNVSDGTPTATPTWTPKSRTGVTLSKTLTFSSGDTAVATVNASTGVITGVGVGTTWVMATSNDTGVPGRGIVVVNSTATGGGGGASAVSETFTGADAGTINGRTTTPSGHVWIQRQGVQGIKGNKGSYESGGGDTYCVVDRGAASKPVEITLSTIGGADVQLVFRESGTSNRFYVESIPLAGDILRVRKVVAGTTTLVATTNFALVNGDVLRVEDDGSVIVVKVNAVTRLTCPADTDLNTNTHCGWGNRDHFDTAFRVDDFSVGA